MIALVRSLPGARADTVGEGSGAPEIAWGDTFAYVDPEDRRHLERWFPPCPPDRHREIAAAYLGSDDGDSDGDSAWEDIAPGYTRYVADAIMANSRRQEDPSSAAAPSSPRVGP